MDLPLARMRLASVLVFFLTPLRRDASFLEEALAWLRGRLARFGFHVVIVGGACGTPRPMSNGPRNASRQGRRGPRSRDRQARRGGGSGHGDTGRLTLGGPYSRLPRACPSISGFVLESPTKKSPTTRCSRPRSSAAAGYSLGAKRRATPVPAALRPLEMEGSIASRSRVSRCRPRANTMVRHHGSLVSKCTTRRPRTGTAARSRRASRLSRG